MVESGKFEIKSGRLNDLNLQTGVGQAVINSEIVGESKVENGIGELSLTAINKGNQSDYTFQTKVGIGSITINGLKCENNKTYGNGQNRIDVNGGIGSIKIIEK